MFLISGLYCIIKLSVAGDPLPPVCVEEDDGYKIWGIGLCTYFSCITIKLSLSTVTFPVLVAKPLFLGLCSICRRNPNSNKNAQRTRFTGFFLYPLPGTLVAYSTLISRVFTFFQRHIAAWFWMLMPAFILLFYNSNRSYSKWNENNLTNSLSEIKTHPWLFNHLFVGLTLVFNKSYIAQCLL
jgi:hypothetical protein